MNRSLSWGTSRRMLPGAGDLAMAEFDRQQARAIDCNECGAEFDRDTEEPHERHVCPECYERMHPRCACGCGEAATIIADVVFPTGIDCRAPWLNIEHALGAQDTNERPTIDVVVPTEDFEKILGAAPCWCGMRETTTCDWCPQHGAKE